MGHILLVLLLSDCLNAARLFLQLYFSFCVSLNFFRYFFSFGLTSSLNVHVIFRGNMRRRNKVQFRIRIRISCHIIGLIPPGPKKAALFHHNGPTVTTSSTL